MPEVGPSRSFLRTKWSENKKFGVKHTNVLDPKINVLIILSWQIILRFGFQKLNLGENHAVAVIQIIRSFSLKSKIKDYGPL